MSEQEFSSMVLPESQRLYRLCCRILCNSEEARDALQEVLIKLWTGRGKLEGMNSIEAYITIITRNHCIDRLRTRRVHLGEEYLNGMDNNQTDYNRDEVDSRVKSIKDAISTLNFQQQQVFTMRDIEGLEFSEIAIQLGVSQENARVILSRARNTIRDTIRLKQSGHGN